MQARPSQESKEPRVMGVAAEFRYLRLTWEEMNEAIAAQKVVILPTGSVEQHGPHLPLDVDTFLTESVCLELGRRAADRRSGLARRPLRTQSPPHRLPGHNPHRARGVCGLLPEHHQESGVSRLSKNPDRQRPRLEHAAGRSGRSKNGAGHPVALCRGQLLQSWHRSFQPREAVGRDGPRRRVRDFALSAFGARAGANAKSRGRRRRDGQVYEFRQHLALRAIQRFLGAVDQSRCPRRSHLGHGRKGKDHLGSPVAPAGRTGRRISRRGPSPLAATSIEDPFNRKSSGDEHEDTRDSRRRPARRNARRRLGRRTATRRLRSHAGGRDNRRRPGWLRQRIHERPPGSSRLGPVGAPLSRRKRHRARARQREAPSKHLLARPRRFGDAHHQRHRHRPVGPVGQGHRSARRSAAGRPLSRARQALRLAADGRARALGRPSPRTSRARLSGVQNRLGPVRTL